MKRVALLGSTALFGAGMMANTAMAADGIKLGVGGFFRTAYMATFDDDSEGEPGNERNTDGVFCDAEIHFTGSTVLDNGLEVGARVELEGETTSTDGDGDQIDEAWIYLLRRLRRGAHRLDRRRAGGRLHPAARRHHQLLRLLAEPVGRQHRRRRRLPGAELERGLRRRRRPRGRAEAGLHLAVFAGFQLSLSYTPNGGDERHGDGVGAHIGMPFNSDEESRHNFSAYGTYTLRRRRLGPDRGRRRIVRRPCRAKPGPGPRRAAILPDRRQPHLRQLRGRRHVRILQQPGRTSTSATTVDAWVAGGGVAYTMDAWTFGAQYSHQLADTRRQRQTIDFTMDRAVLTANYALGPGIDLDGVGRLHLGRHRSRCRRQRRQL